MQAHTSCSTQQDACVHWRNKQLGYSKSHRTAPVSISAAWTHSQVLVSSSRCIYAHPRQSDGTFRGGKSREQAASPRREYHKPQRTRFAESHTRGHASSSGQLRTTRWFHFMLQVARFSENSCNADFKPLHPRERQMRVYHACDRGKNGTENELSSFGPMI